MLELNDIRFRPATSERVILNDINLKASAGEPVLISGNSGSGKTSLLEVISGLAGAQKGTIHWNQEALTRRQRRWICGVVFQFPERHFLGLNVSQELEVCQFCFQQWKW